MKQKRVCIIGAGVSGLISIKYCLEAGFKPVCFEKDHHAGGLWNRKNPKTVPYCTITNTSKELSCFSDFPMPDEYPNFLPPDRLMDYFYSYAMRFDLLKYIEMDTEVTKIESNDSNNGHYWTVSTIEKQKSEKIHHFDYLIISTGFNRSAYIPDKLKEKIDKFSGKVVHSTDYKSWQKFENQTVVISGFGNSAGDISAELSRHTRKVILATKHGGYIANRLVFGGYPFDVKFLRKATGWLPTAVKNVFIKKMCNGVIDHSNFGLELVQNSPTASINPVINDEVPTRIATGHITVKPEISSIEGRQVTFKDGFTIEDVDAIILCTGYKRYFSFLEKNSVFSFGNEGKTFPLYKNIFPVEHRGKVAFVGTTAVVGSVFPTYEMQARCAVEVFLDNVQLPQEGEMTEIIDKDAEKAKISFGNEARELMRVAFIPYQDDLADMIGVKPNIWKLWLTDPLLAYHLLFGPSCPYQYRLVGRNSWSGARNAILTVNQRIWAPLKTLRTFKHQSVSSLKFFLIIFVVAYFIFLAFKM